MSSGLVINTTNAATRPSAFVVDLLYRANPQQNEVMEFGLKLM